MNVAETTKTAAEAAIAVTALSEITTAIFSGRDLSYVRRACMADPYWPEFCDLVAAGRVRDDFAGPGVLGRVVLGWARGL